ncbi:MAG: hypothetical protein JXA93_19775 [Anaerolineae bacterium]|nr:hypothetical protein [Anaerolineae bacterium]
MTETRERKPYVTPAIKQVKLSIGEVTLGSGCFQTSIDGQQPQLGDDGCVDQLCIYP